jgi:hypothetical protein
MGDTIESNGVGEATWIPMVFLHHLTARQYQAAVDAGFTKVVQNFNRDTVALGGQVIIEKRVHLVSRETPVPTGDVGAGAGIGLYCSVENARLEGTVRVITNVIVTRNVTDPLLV